ncbi:MAG: alpha-hydroxy-acid oxidizing protein [Candidatus Dormibacteraeota bacterium]|nr:alpha-hydroxy-acid oxidizing protein [Candidatus Dormibacteraeota bacterium]
MATVERASKAELAPPVRLDDYEPRARALLPPTIYDYFAGGAEDEAALAGNRAAYGRFRFRFKVLSSVPEPDLSCEILAERFTMPVQLAPTATQKMAHPEGEIAAARAAADAGIAYSLSTLSTVSLEDVGAACHGAKWFQLYMYRDRGITIDLIDRAAAAGYTAVMLTVDTPRLGRRERDFRNAFGLPEGMRYENLAGALRKTGTAEVGQSALSAYFTSQLDSWLTWKDLEWLVGKCRLPVMAKGVVRGDDARHAVESGVRVVVVSNHGGRQLDYSVATLDALPEVVQAVANDVPVMVDGGVRRGTDVLKALCLGASSVLIGRPYLWALAVGGQEGVARALELIRDEIAVSMMLLGVKNLSELSQDLLVRA